MSDLITPALLENSAKNINRMARDLGVKRGRTKAETLSNIVTADGVYVCQSMAYNNKGELVTTFKVRPPARA